MHVRTVPFDGALWNPAFPLVTVAVWSRADHRGWGELAHELDEARPRCWKGSFGARREAAASAGIVVPPKPRDVIIAIVRQKLGEHAELRLDERLGGVGLIVAQIPVGIGALYVR